MVCRRGHAMVCRRGHAMVWLTVGTTYINGLHTVTLHSVGMSMVIVDCVSIAFIRCKDLLCLQNYIQLYSWFILNNYCVIMVHIV